MGLKESKNGLKIKTNSIIEDYIIKDEIIGTGLRGNILACYPKSDKKKKFALKILYYKDYKEKQSAKNEFELQWKACNRSNHIVKIIDIYKTNIEGHKAYLMIMEYISGGKLIDYLSKNSIDKKIELTEKRAAMIMSQLFEAVNDIHSLEIAHRDFTLDHILIEENDNYGNIKVTHFMQANDIGKEISPNIKDPKYRKQLIQVNKTEQFSNDMYGLGLIMHFLCCGHGPKEESNFENLDNEEWDHLSNEAKELLKGLLTNEVNRRFTIEEVRNREWIRNAASTPKTPLNNLKMVLEEKENAVNAIEEMNLKFQQSIEERRVGPSVTLQSLSKSNNKLLLRRANKNKANNEQKKVVLQSQLSKISKKSARFK